MNNVEQFNKNLFLENDKKIAKMEYQKCFIELFDKKFKLNDIVQYRDEYYDMYKKSENISDKSIDKGIDKMFYIKVKGSNIENIKKYGGKTKRTKTKTKNKKNKKKQRQNRKKTKKHLNI